MEYDQPLKASRRRSSMERDQPLKSSGRRSSVDQDQPLKASRRRSSLGDCLKASSLLRKSSGLISDAPVKVAFEECEAANPDLQDLATPNPVKAAPEPPTTDNDGSLPPSRQTRRDRLPTKLRHRTCSPRDDAIDETNITTPKVFSICSFDTDLPPKAVQHRHRLRDWAESAHVLKGDNDTLRRAVKAMVTGGQKTSRLQEAAAHLWEAFRSGSNGRSTTDQMEKARLFANLPLPLPDMQDDPAFEQIVNLQRTAAMLYAQYAMVPHSVHSENPNNSDIILESSCIDQHIMSPWSDIDPDIRHDFFVDYPPDIAVDEYFRSPLVSCVADSFKTGPKSESPTLVAPSAIPPVPGGPLGATTISGWDESGMWTDPHAGIQLAKKQLRKIHQWVRISELPKYRDAFSLARGKSQAAVEVCMFARKPSAWSIRQGFVGDCSFLSSLAALAEFDRRFDQTNLTSLIFPRKPNPETGVSESTINPRGMYACRLFFNGVFRKVLIDDRVPIKESGKLLAAHSAHPGEMWVTLLEKAFIKLMGGSYYMRGSNPGADLFHLTGWIPETLPFRSDVQMGSPNNMSSMVTGGPMSQSVRYRDDPFWLSAWQRLHNGLERGHCVACLGTTEVVDAAPFGLDFPEGVSVSSGVVAKHAYSVLRTTQVNMGGRTLRLLFVKNPWGIVRWKGAFGPTDNTNWTKQLQDLLSYDQPSEAAVDNGTYWIQWHDVVFWFSHLYMCWNDQPYPHSSIVHTCWTVTPKMMSTSLTDDSHLVAFNPQHCLELLPELSSLKKDSSEYARVLRRYDLTGSPREEVEVKVFFSRHVRGRQMDPCQRYLALHVHSGGEFLTCPGIPSSHGLYCNGECSLTTLRVRPFGRPDKSSTQRKKDVVFGRHFMLVVSQFNQKSEFNFTIKTYSLLPSKLTLVDSPIKPDWECVEFRDEWAEHTAGGCSNEMWGYFDNPCYRMEVEQEVEAFIFLECPAELSVNLRLFHHPFATPRLLRMGPVVTSGSYRSGSCVIHQTLFPGIYTLLPSTFVKGRTAQFRLAVHHSGPHGCLTLRPLPTPYPRRPPGHFNMSWANCQAKGEFGGFVGIMVPARTQLAIRLVVKDFSSKDHFASLVVFRAKDAYYNQLGPDTTEVPRGFRAPQLSSPSAMEDQNYIMIRRSDLEGGISHDGRTTSSASVELWNSHRTVVVSLLEPEKDVFYMLRVGHVSAAKLTSPNLYDKDERLVPPTGRYAVFAVSTVQLFPFSC